MKIKELRDYFSRPGVNKSIICRYAGVDLSHLNDVLKGKYRLTDKMKKKLKKGIDKNCRENCL